MTLLNSIIYNRLPNTYSCKSINMFYPKNPRPSHERPTIKSEASATGSFITELQYRIILKKIER